MHKYSTAIIIFSIFLFTVLSCNSSNDSSENETVVAGSNDPENAVFKNVLIDKGFGDLGTLGQSASWGDINNDGFLDIALGNTDLRSRSFYLYQNDGSGNFNDITEGSGIGDQPIRSLTWADYDNDGYIDLALGTIRGGAPPVLYKNLKNSSFMDVTSKAGLTRKDGFLFNVIWSDYNLDGHVDLFQINARELHLYKNIGNGIFEEVASEAGIVKENFTRGAVLFDFNNDMYPDLFLANSGSDNFFINNGDGTFKDITSEAGLDGGADSNTGPVCTGDFNNDGFIDLYLGSQGRRRNVLFRNNGDGTFTDISEKANVKDVGDARTCSFVDYDSDGLIDIVATNHINPNKLFKNKENEEFEDVAEQVGIRTPIIDVFSTAWADYNQDGFMDVFLYGHIGIGLMENSGNKNNNIIIELIGNGSTTNMSAISSRIILQTENGTQTREVAGGGGCCEQNMLPVHFGVGNETKADILVKWTDGVQCDFQDFDINKNTRINVNQTGCKLEVL